MNKRQISTKKRYLSEHQEEITRHLQKGGFNIITAPTGSGKTHFIKEYCQQNTKGINIFLAPMAVIVDQFREELAQNQFNLQEVNISETLRWGFHETYEWSEDSMAVKTEDGDGVVAVSTFASFIRNIDSIDFSCVDTIFIDEVHMLSTMASYANDTIGPLWNLIVDRKQDEEFECTFVGLTAEKDYIEKFNSFWNCDMLIHVDIEWYLKPKSVILIEDRKDKWQQNIVDYIGTNVGLNESVLIIAERTSQVERLLNNSAIPEVKRGTIARDKTGCDVYNYLCTHSAFPKEVRIYVATTFMSTGANINNENFKHVICLFPDLLIAKQAMSRARAGDVNLVIFRDKSINRAYQDIDKSKVDRYLKALRELRTSSEEVYRAGRKQKLSELSGMADVHSEYQKRIFASRDKMAEVCKELFKVETVLFKDVEELKKNLGEVVRLTKKERKTLSDYFGCNARGLKTKIAEDFPSSKLIDSNTASWFYKFSNSEELAEFKKCADYTCIIK